MQYVMDELEKDPRISFDELKKRAGAFGLNLPPIVYGRAKRRLGITTEAEAVREPTSGAERAFGAAEEVTEPELSGLSLDAPEAPAQFWSGGDEPADAGDEADDEAGAASDTDSDGHGEPTPTAAPARKGTALDFAMTALRLNPDASYQDLKLRADLEGVRLPPILYGRAKALLGLVSSKPRQPRRKLPSGPLNLVQVDSPDQVPKSLGGLDAVLTQLRRIEQEHQQMRQALAAIQQIVEEALDD